MSAKENVSFHVGQAGAQIGCEFWRLLEAERTSAVQENSQKDFKSFFYQNCSSNALARAIFVDYDAGVIDHIKKGPQRDYLNHFITHKEDSGGFCTRAYYTLYREILEPLEEKIRKLCEGADNLEGFTFTTSVMGGTGPGVTYRILEHLARDYPKKPSVVFNLYPSAKQATNIVEPLNASFGMCEIPSLAALNVVFDNEALYNYSEDNLGDPCPNYTDINSLIAQAMSAFSLSTREVGVLGASLRDILTNLVPFPKLNSATLSMASQPLSNNEKEHAENTTESLTRSTFNKQYSLSSIDNNLGKYIATNLTLRGPKIDMGEVLDSVRIIRPWLYGNFAGFSPSGMKLSLYSSEPRSFFKEKCIRHKATVSNLTNTTALKSYYKLVSKKFATLFEKRAFIHWYVGEGLEHGEIESWQRQLDNQISNFVDLEKESGGEEA